MSNVFLRDCSDYDTNESLVGFDGGTNKYSEGTKVTHTSYGPRLNRWRAGGAKVLGSYHVLRTPGSGGNGSLSSQLDFWLSGIDRLTPWWRTVPFILQIDAERWPYDAVTLNRPMPYPDARHLLDRAQFEDIRAARTSTTIQFAQLLVNAGVPGWKVCYASRGQYGDSLAGLPVPLWNAAYHSGTYPGDGAADWAAYSGQVPEIWQFTSTPFDKSAYRGSIGDLLALIKGAKDMDQTEVLLVKSPNNPGRRVADHFTDLSNLRDYLIGSGSAVPGATGFPTPTSPLGVLLALPGQVAGLAKAVDVLAAGMAALAVGGTSLDTAAVVTAIQAAAQSESATLADLRRQVTDLTGKLAKAGQDLA